MASHSLLMLSSGQESREKEGPGLLKSMVREMGDRMQKEMFITKFNVVCKERVDALVLDIIQRRDEEPSTEAAAVGIVFDGEGSG